MVLMQSNQRYSTYAELDTTTGIITWRSKETDRAASLAEMGGHIVVLDGYPVCLYRAEGRLHLRIAAVDTEITDDTTADLVQGEQGGASTLTVSRQGIVCFRWTYTRPIIDPPLAVDPTPFVGEEDFDFGVFVRNVISEPRRRQRMYRRDQQA